jgi:sarcosine oxidase delta subunit
MIIDFHKGKALLSPHVGASWQQVFFHRSGPVGFSAEKWSHSQKNFLFFTEYPA